MITQFNTMPNTRRRITGILPMPDGTRRIFNGCNMAEVLRQWQQAMTGGNHEGTRPRHC